MLLQLGLLAFPAFARKVGLNSCKEGFESLVDDLQSANHQRVERLGRLFEQYGQKYVDNPLAGVRELFANRDLLPENGVLHVVGPDLNFYEWLLPVISRSDITVVVSDKLGEAQRVLKEPGRFDVFWKILQRDNASLLQSSRFGALDGKEKLLEALRRQVVCTDDVEKSHDLDGKSIPPANLLLAHLPLHTGWNFAQHLRENSLVWVKTELKDRVPPSAVVLTGPVASFAPKQNGAPSTATGRSWGLQIDEAQSYLWIVEAPN